VSFNPKNGTHNIQYDDGDVEDTDLQVESILLYTESVKKDEISSTDIDWIDTYSTERVMSLRDIATEFKDVSLYKILQLNRLQYPSIGADTRLKKGTKVFIRPIKKNMNETSPSDKNSSSEENIMALPAKKKKSINKPNVLSAKKKKSINKPKASPTHGRCGRCTGCRRPHCGQCRFCVDMRRFGGEGKLRKSCTLRVCEQKKKMQKKKVRQRNGKKRKKTEEDSSSTESEDENIMMILAKKKKARQMNVKKRRKTEEEEKEEEEEEEEETPTKKKLLRDLSMKELKRKQLKVQRRLEHIENEIWSRKNQKNEHSEEMLCVVCKKEKRDTVLLPCRHLCVCGGCSNDLDNCPACQANIGAHVKINIL